ncbi:MAG TPA: hypothetical protein VEP90_25890 [Methylomirabilota bacterium]|nr:hypothetical protein [Methylomirabilota bacterium]
MIHSKGGGVKGQPGACGQDSENDGHIINQLRKIVDLDVARKLKFLDGSEQIVLPRIAYEILKVYDELITSIQKQSMTNSIWKDSSMISSITEQYIMINNKNNKKETISHVTVDKYGPSSRVA